MRKQDLDISVIIPTHNRFESLKKVLDSFSFQSYPSDKFELIVIADGCTDNTINMLNKCKYDFDLIIYEQENKGLASARNKGAELANSNLLIFLDDDIIASQGFLEAHADAHKEFPNSLVIGYYPMELSDDPNLLELEQYAAWEKVFSQLKNKYHLFRFYDFHSGNHSIEKDLYINTGQFDTNFKTYGKESYGREDWEYGIRLLQSGVRFVYCEQAMGYHYPYIDIKRILKLKYSEGLADIKICRKHPDVINCFPTLGIISNKRLLINLPIRFIIKYKHLSDLIAHIMFIILNMFMKFKIRRPWKYIWDKLINYWYMRGIVDELDKEEKINDFFESNKVDLNYDNVIKVDISGGFEKAEKLVDEKKPDRINIYYKDMFLCNIDSKPGFEKIRGVHLSKLMTAEKGLFLFKALLEYGETPFIKKEDLYENYESWMDILQGQKLLMDSNKGDIKHWNRFHQIARTFWIQQAKIKQLTEEKQ